MKTCITCKHHEARTITGRFMGFTNVETKHHCIRNPDLVTGEKSYADCHRLRHWDELCGEGGKWWEQRE
jgi:hypothetical protein